MISRRSVFAIVPLVLACRGSGADHAARRHDAQPSPPDALVAEAAAVPAAPLVRELHIWNETRRVRVTLASGDWTDDGRERSDRSLELHPPFAFPPVTLRLAVTCSNGSCDAQALPKQIVAHAREQFDFVRSPAHQPQLVPRWIVAPKQEPSGLFYWRFVATGKHTEGKVAIVRLLPQLDMVLECTGEAGGDQPSALDDIERTCRSLTYEIVP